MKCQFKDYIFILTNRCRKLNHEPVTQDIPQTLSQAVSHRHYVVSEQDYCIDGHLHWVPKGLMLVIGWNANLNPPVVKDL